MNHSTRTDGQKSRAASLTLAAAAVAGALVISGCATSGGGASSTKYVPPAAMLPTPEKEPPIVEPKAFGASPSDKDVRAFNRAGGFWLGPNQRPADAVVLFDGKALSNWTAMDGSPTKWVVKDGVLESVKGAGYIRTKQEFDDFQLHIEWATPSKVEGNGQGRGNSGVFLHGVYEIQVLDSHDNKTYFHGQAGAIYKQYPPLVNVSRRPGEWQTYDIVFHGPRFDASNNVTRPAYVTVLHNGVLIQDNVMLLGNTYNNKPAAYTPGLVKGPLSLQDHGNPVRFRNIWVRPL